MERSRSHHKNTYTEYCYQHYIGVCTAYTESILVDRKMRVVEM